MPPHLTLAATYCLHHPSPLLPISTPFSLQHDLRVLPTDLPHRALCRPAALARSGPSTAHWSTPPCADAVPEPSEPPACVAAPFPPTVAAGPPTDAATAYIRLPRVAICLSMLSPAPLVHCVSPPALLHLLQIAVPPSVSPPASSARPRRLKDIF